MRKAKGDQPERPANVKDAAGLARSLLTSGNYRFTAHVLERMKSRSINQMDVRDVLLAGSREPSKDKYDVNHNEWTYSFRASIEDRDLRVIVAFTGTTMLIVVTAINKTLKEN